MSDNPLENIASDVRDPRLAELLRLEISRPVFPGPVRRVIVEHLAWLSDAVAVPAFDVIVAFKLERVKSDRLGLRLNAKSLAVLSDLKIVGVIGLAFTYAYFDHVGIVQHGGPLKQDCVHAYQAWMTDAKNHPRGVP